VKEGDSGAVTIIANETRRGYQSKCRVQVESKPKEVPVEDVRTKGE
jgi:hypothetical protein